MPENAKAPTALICLSPHVGGMELAAVKLARTLNEKVDLTFIVQEKKFIHEQCRTNPDYRAIPVETIRFSTTLLSPSIIFGVRKIIREKGIRNVIFVGASELKSLYFAFWGLGINLIVRHGTIKKHPKKDWFHRLVYSDVAWHVAISKYMTGNVEAIVPFGKRSRITVIVPSLPKPVSILERTPSPTLRLLHAGRVTSGKGIDKAIEACAVLAEHGIDFTLDNYGPEDPKYTPALNALLARIGYRDRIRINGFTNAIYDEYRRHDLFLFPTPDEGYGNVMMEAIAHGIIVLAFDNTAISNFGEMGFHIHLVEDGSLDALKERLLYIATHLDEEKRLAEANMAKAADVFSREREAAQYLELLI